MPKADNLLPCFPDKTAFEEWLRLARDSGPLGPDSPCTDCTPSFQADMKDEGLCAHPEVEFVTLRTKLAGGEVEEELVGVHVVMRRHHRRMRPVS